MIEITGESAERFVREVAETACVADFVFANPKYFRGKYEKELCDLLIVIEKTIIVIQVKAAESLRQAQRLTLDKASRWNAKKQIEARDQVVGAKRALRNGLCNTVVNDRRGKVELGRIDEYEMLGITVVDRPEIKQNGLRSHGERIRVLNLNFVEFKHMLAELSTAGDLVDYLAWRFQVDSQLTLLDAGELDVLALYLSRRTEADLLVDGKTTLILGSVWETYVSSDVYKVHKRVQKVSFLFDVIVRRCHEAKDVFSLLKEEKSGGDGLGLPQAEYIKICERLQRFRRRERISICEKVIEKDRLAVESGVPRHFSQLPARDGAPVFVFVAHGGTREERVSRLNLIMSCCAVEWPEREVVGVASSLSNQETAALEYGYVESLAAYRFTVEQVEELREIRSGLFKPSLAVEGNEFDRANEIVRRKSMKTLGGSKADQMRNRRFKSRKRKK